MSNFRIPNQTGLLRNIIISIEFSSVQALTFSFFQLPAQFHHLQRRLLASWFWMKKSESLSEVSMEFTIKTKNKKLKRKSYTPTPYAKTFLPQKMLPKDFLAPSHYMELSSVTHNTVSTQKIPIVIFFQGRIRRFSLFIN